MKKIEITEEFLLKNGFIRVNKDGIVRFYHPRLEGEFSLIDGRLSVMIRKKNMKKIKIVIERSNDLFSAYALNVEGVYGAGNTVSEAKESALNSIELLRKYNKDNVPSIIKNEYLVVFKFDVESFLNYYKGIFTNAAKYTILI